MSLPGTPVLYYGDEIGDGRQRLPRRPQRRPHAHAVERGPQRRFLDCQPAAAVPPGQHRSSVPLRVGERRAHLDNPDSLLRWMRRLIALRKRHPVFGRGKMDFVASDNPRVLAFIRHDESEQRAWSSRTSPVSPSSCELDLSAHRGAVPRELFGQRAFPMIGELPYLVTLAPYSFYWLSLGGPATEAQTATLSLPSLRVPAPWWRVTEGDDVQRLEAILPAILRNRRWFGSKDQRIQSVTIVSRASIPLESEAERAELLVVNVDYLAGEPERYLLTLVQMTGDQASNLAQDQPEAVLALTTGPNGEVGLLVDAHFDPAFGKTLVDLVANRRRRSADSGARLRGVPLAATSQLLSSISTGRRSVARVSTTEQSNTSVIVGEPESTRCHREDAQAPRDRRAPRDRARSAPHDRRGRRRPTPWVDRAGAVRGPEHRCGCDSRVPPERVGCLERHPAGGIDLPRAARRRGRCGTHAARAGPARRVQLTDADSRDPRGGRDGDVGDPRLRRAARAPDRQSST